jgi:hypothetical protein
MRIGIRWLGLMIANLLLCNVLAPLQAVAVGKEISEIFIEATGNNKYESKVKAHDFGMRRALLLIADQIGIKKENISKIPLSVLKKIFTPVMVSSEVSAVDHYNATVTYSYELSRIYSTLLKFGDPVVDDLFYEFLIFPIFKQKNFLNIWNEEKRWNNYWIQSRNLLEHHKIYYPEKTPYIASKITGINIFDLKYEDFIDIFPQLLFKKVMIVTAEFFTNRKTRASILQIKKIILSPESETVVIEDEYPLVHFEDIADNINLLIDKIVNKFGAIRHFDDNHDDEEVVADSPEIHPIIMNFDAYDQEEIDVLREKLSKVDEIDSFKIQQDYNTKYKILIYTTRSEYELAEGFYINGLSYKIHGSLYNLIDIKKGS